MSSLQLGFLAVYFSGRLFFYDVQLIMGNRTVQRAALIKRAGWGLGLIFFSQNLEAFLAVFFIHLTMVIVDSFLRSRKPTLNRLYYAVHLTAALFIWSVLIGGLNAFLTPTSNPFYLRAFFAHTSVLRYVLIFDGFLLTQKEATIFIRLILQKLRAIPRQEPEKRKTDKKEYEFGRIIGMLERTFLYFLIIWNQVGAIAILIALKSLARYKELENKYFAEYFLIGSLLSILAAVVPAVAVLMLLK